MPTEARIAVLRAGSMDLSVEDVELPDPSPGQVLIRNLGAGICHSQLHEMHAERSGDILPGPRVLRNRRCRRIRREER